MSLFIVQPDVDKMIHNTFVHYQTDYEGVEDKFLLEINSNWGRIQIRTRENFINFAHLINKTLSQMNSK